jgi:hypothetical protein
MSCGVAGDPADPLTAQRRAGLAPVTTALVRQVEAQTGTVQSTSWGTPPPSLPVPKRMPCARYDAGVAAADAHAGVERRVGRDVPHLVSGVPVVIDK